MHAPRFKISLLVSEEATADLREQAEQVADNAPEGIILNPSLDRDRARVPIVRGIKFSEENTVERHVSETFSEIREIVLDKYTQGVEEFTVNNASPRDENLPNCVFIHFYDELHSDRYTVTETLLEAGADLDAHPLQTSLPILSSEVNSLRGITGEDEDPPAEIRWLKNWDTTQTTLELPDRIPIAGYQITRYDQSNFKPQGEVEVCSVTEN